MTLLFDTKTTRDHVDIRRWVEERGGMPSMFDDDGAGDKLLVIDFNEPDNFLEVISWEEFFAIFDENDLAFVYQEAKTGGDLGYFYQIIGADQAAFPVNGASQRGS